MWKLLAVLGFITVVASTIPHMHSRRSSGFRKENLEKMIEHEQVFQIPLDGSGNTKLSWVVDYSKELIRAEVHFKGNTTDWFAIGFSDYGEETSADYCIFWVDWQGRVEFQDTYAEENGKIRIDDQQNCNEFRFVRKGLITKFVFIREFDTCDDMDYVIEEGTTHVVWAQGVGPLFRLGGLNIKNAQFHGMQRTQLLKNLNAPSTNHPPDVWTYEVTAKHVSVPSSDTTYWCEVNRLPNALRTKQHMIQFEAIITPGNEALVHHMELFHCVAPADQIIPKYSGNCFAEERPSETQVCKKVIAAWAMGALPFVYPEVAGYNVGGEDFNQYVMLEVHYNNPEMRSDWKDNSGIRIYLTPKLRKYNSGVIELGLEYTDKMAIPSHQPGFTLSGFCIAECTAVSLPPEGILVFGSQLHTHLTGTKVMTRHIRDGKELPLMNWDFHYSTHFQEIRSLKRLVNILPGDALITTCTYKTSDKENITLGGFAISDEMCVNYIHYYPKVDLEVCKSSISYESLFTYFRFLNEWEGQRTNVNQGISDNYKSIEWTPARATILHELYEESPLSMQCNQSNGNRFPGYWENLPVTKVNFPLPPEPRNCENVVF